MKHMKIINSLKKNLIKLSFDLKVKAKMKIFQIQLSLLQIQYYQF